AVHCRRDARMRPVDARTGQVGRANRWLRRRVWDVPLCGHRVALDIEYLEIAVGARERRVEQLAFAESGARYTRRLAALVSALCRHLPISAVSRWTGLAWATVKDMDRTHLRASLPALNPRDITGVRVLGVDEVARAKGHDYVTVVYDLDRGTLLWVGDGKSADSLGVFLAELSQETADGIQAVAMDMGPAYQAAVKAQLPKATIVFDRFHVMKLYSDVIRKVRKTEFRKADAEGKEVIKGSLYLLLGNKQRLDESGARRLDELMQANQTLSTVYTLKEQLQALWSAPDEAAMREALSQWCELARAASITPLHRYAATLENHADGICAYARFKLTTARIEAGNVAIGMIRKRARGLLDQDYFKLKIRQTAVPEPPLALFPKARKLPHASS
ncbi:MAG: ISL3 family transposase, partial [Stenotrophobium sp.]